MFWHCSLGHFTSLLACIIKLQSGLLHWLNMNEQNRSKYIAYVEYSHYGGFHIEMK